MFSKCFYSHNFGHNGPLDFHGLGINAKISELQAAMGLTVLPYMDEIIENRKGVVSFYKENLDWNNLKPMELRAQAGWNYSYFPVIFASEKELLLAQNRLNANQIFPRRYFYPSLNTIDFANSERNEANISESVSSRIICLPLFKGLELKDLKMIVELI